MNLAAERTFIRDILADLIGDKGGAYTYLPGRMVLPAWLVTPADNYLTSGQTFGTATIHLTVTYIAEQAADNEVSTQEVDDAMSAAITTFVSDYSNIHIESGTSPFSTSINGSAYLAQSVQIAFSINL